MNALTERLLAAGYTKDHHPPNVRWHIGFNGFQFTHDYLCTTVWETPCGLLKGGHYFCGFSTSHMGIDYEPENNNPLGSCPYRDEGECAYRLPKAFVGERCVFHYTTREYDYESSCKKVEKTWDIIQHEALQKVTDGYGYCDCFQWDQPSRSYIPKYWVERCINHGCENTVCAITKKERNLEKVNIFYDLLRVKQYRIGFADFVDKSLEKGLKQFKRPVARTDAEIWFNTYGNDGLRHSTKRQDRIDSHFSEYHGEQGFGEYDYFYFEVTAQNVRIERRESRDLLQDLRDVENGIRVTHASDLKKTAAAAKRKRKEDRQAAKSRAAERSNIKKWQHMVATGMTPDGEPCGEGLLNFCKKELSKRGLLDIPEQISLWGNEDGQNESDNPGRLSELRVEDEDNAVHDEHSVLAETA